MAIPIPFEENVTTLRKEKIKDENTRTQENDGFNENDFLQGPRKVDQEYSKKQILNIEKLFPNAKPIGLGNMGIAYDIGDKILKVTVDWSEFDSAKQLMKKPLETHVIVYEVNEKYKYIIIEKIKPLKTIEKEVYYILYQIYSQFFSNKKPTTETFVQQIQKVKNRKDVQSLLQTDEFYTLIPPFVTFINKLKEYGLNPQHLDIHDDNVGIDNNGNIKILDLGMSLY